jgi:antitoxin component YwqK of YwqJK toxin-antitoxin module
LFCLAACGQVEVKKEHYPDGAVMAEHVMRGSRSVMKAYLPDGTLISEKRYRNGKLDGESRIYRNDGRLFAKVTYRGGEEIRRREFRDAVRK